MKNLPLVSVIMPAYNVSKVIAESIESVLSQSYRNWELIIINDGSSDDTLAVSKHFQGRDNRITLINLKHNVGAANARNTGLLRAKGELIAFLDSDDLWERGMLEIQVSFHLKTQVKISHTNFVWFNERGVVNRLISRLLYVISKKSGILYPHICYRNRINFSTVMLEKSLVEEVNYFDDIDTNEDYYLCIKIAKKRYNFGYINRKLAKYRILENSLSHQTDRFKRDRKKLISNVSQSDDNLNAGMMWKYYYGNYGLIHYRSKNYKLAILYYIKCIKCCPLHYISLLVLLHLALIKLKQGFNKVL
ncbi:MAG: glycosyltransferase family 2 protein [Ekhidna sp.]|nr:glycosyltransferase family 2 protein [Ekhidna sp.]